jgi:hypothetical protein
MKELLPEAPFVPPGRTRGLRFALWTIYILLAFTCLCGASALIFHWRGFGFSRIIGAVFLLFGLFKIVLAWDALVAPTAQAPQSDQRQEVGTPGMFRLWVSYKVWAGLLAVLVGLVLMILGSRMLDQMPLMLK